MQAVRQLGVGVPSGLDIACRTAKAALENFMDGLDEAHHSARLPVALQYDFENGFNRLSRVWMIELCEKHTTALLQYTRLLYDKPATS